MRQTVTMPALSDTMNNGRLVKWLKQVGQPVKRGEVIAEVETDKAVMEVEAFHDGYLGGPLAAADSEYPVGQAIGYIVGSPAEAAGDAPAVPSPEPPRQPGPVAAPGPAVATMPWPAAPTPTPRASPYARRLAQQLGVDLGAAGSGAGAVRAADVLCAAHAAAMPDLDAGPPWRIERNSSLREAVAQTMIASAATPTFRVTAELVVGPLILTAKAKGWSLNVLFARAAALAIKEHPLFNAVHTPEGLARRERIDIGIAVDMPDGLITPVLRDVGGRSFVELTQDWRGLVEKAVKRRLTPAEYRGATFYVSDLGVFPVVYAFDSVIPLGASALLSIAAAHGQQAFCTLNCDHRVIFGGDAARFLGTLAKRLVEPESLVR